MSLVLYVGFGEATLSLALLDERRDRLEPNNVFSVKKQNKKSLHWQQSLWRAFREEEEDVWWWIFIMDMCNWRRTALENKPLRCLRIGSKCSTNNYCICSTEGTESWWLNYKCSPIKWTEITFVCASFDKFSASRPQPFRLQEKHNPSTTVSNEHYCIQCV